MDFSRIFKQNDTAAELETRIGARLSSSNCSLPSNLYFQPDNVKHIIFSRILIQEKKEEFYQILIFCGVLALSAAISYCLIFRIGHKVFNYTEAVKVSSYVVILKINISVVVTDSFLAFCCVGCVHCAYPGSNQLLL